MDYFLEQKNESRLLWGMFILKKNSKTAKYEVNHFLLDLHRKVLKKVNFAK